MKLLDLYSMIIANWINGGAYVKMRKMQATDISPEYNVIFTKNAVKKVYQIVGIKPVNLDVAFIEFIRERMFDLNPDVEVAITVHNYPVRVDVTGEKFNRAMSRASESYTSYKEAFDSQSGLARLTGKTYRMPGGGRLRLSKDRLDMLYQAFISYYYLYNHVSAGGTCALTKIFIEIIGKDVRTVKRAGEDLYGLLGPMNIGVDEVKSVLRTYMQEFGVAVPPPMKLNKKFLPQLLFTDENSTAFSSYKGRGLVGGKGILLGLDVRSRLPLSVNLFDSPAAQVFLLCGRTGSGKTYAAFQFALSAMAQGIAVSAIDIKGREWSRLSCCVKPKILTFDEKHPSFVNTLRLDDLHATQENAEELYATAVNGTVMLLKLIINIQENEGNFNDLELVLREAVNKVYSQNGVDPKNCSTFAYSKDLTYAMLLPMLEQLLTTKTYTPSQKHMLSLARSRCHAYFGPGGIFSRSFENEISLGDILESPFVIYELNKNQNAMTDSLDTLRLFMIQYLDGKKMAALKERKKYIVLAYEELQRAPELGSLLTYVAHTVTGARSNNAIVLLLMNSLKVLRQDAARDVRSNITSVVCGFVEDNDIKTLRDEFDRPWLASQLELFREHPNLYRNNFAMDCDTGSTVLRTIYKVRLPDSLAEQFRTRDIREGL